MNEDAAVLAAIITFAISVFFYFLPWFIALFRKHENTGGIFVVTLLTGWTGIGWIAALIWSFIDPAPAQATQATQCPSCREPVQPEATKCKHCGETFDQPVLNQN